MAGGNNVNVALLDDEQTDSDAGREALLAADFVLISGSVTPSNLSPDLAQLPVPIGNFSGAASADLGLATVSGETDSGESFIVMNPDTADHPAGGVVDRAEVFTAPTATLNSGEVGGDAIVVATSPGTPSTPVCSLASLPTVSGVSAARFFATFDSLAGRS